MESDAGSGKILNSQSRSVAIAFSVFGVLAMVQAIAWRDRPFNLIAGLTVCPLCVFFAVKTSRAAITWDRNGVESRGTVRHRRVAWSAIEGFDHRDAVGLRVRLVNGVRVPLMAYPRNRLNDPDAALAILRGALARYRTPS